VDATAKCANPDCTSVPTTGKEYCSDSCAIAKDRLQLTCQRPHPGCEGEH
jgi:hypothetical protein